jgi:hypothetical protein
MSSRFLDCRLYPSFTPVRAQQPSYPFHDLSLPMEKRIDNLLSLITIDAEVNCLSTNTGMPRLGVPNYGSSKGVHGVVQRDARGSRQPITTTQFPQPPGTGESWDSDLVREAGGVEGEDHRSESSSNFDQRLFWEYYSVPFLAESILTNSRADRGRNEDERR